MIFAPVLTRVSTITRSKSGNINDLKPVLLPLALGHGVSDVENLKHESDNTHVKEPEICKWFAVIEPLLTLS
jgi:hypothetical protein